MPAFNRLTQAASLPYKPSSRTTSTRVVSPTPTKPNSPAMLKFKSTSTSMVPRSRISSEREKGKPRRMRRNHSRPPCADTLSDSVVVITNMQDTSIQSVQSPESKESPSSRPLPSSPSDPSFLTGPSPNSRSLAQPPSALTASDPKPHSVRRHSKYEASPLVDSDLDELDSNTPRMADAPTDLLHTPAGTRGKKERNGTSLQLDSIPKRHSTPTPGVIRLPINNSPVDLSHSSNSQSPTKRRNTKRHNHRSLPVKQTFTVSHEDPFVAGDAALCGNTKKDNRLSAPLPVKSSSTPSLLSSSKPLPRTPAKASAIFITPTRLPSQVLDGTSELKSMTLPFRGSPIPTRNRDKPAGRSLSHSNSLDEALNLMAFANSTFQNAPSPSNLPKPRFLASGIGGDNPTDVEFLTGSGP